MSRMTQARYDEILREAGEWLDQPIRHPFEFGEACGLRQVAAVYVVTNIWGEAIYVGSARRSRGVGSRIREHLRVPRRSGAWRHVWIVPLREAATLEDVREIEGRIGMRLLPTGNAPLPKARWVDTKAAKASATLRRRRAVASASPPAAA
jgi:hypothetical protein